MAVSRCDPLPDRPLIPCSPEDLGKAKGEQVKPPKGTTMSTTDTPIFDQVFAESNETTQRLVLAVIADRPHADRAWDEFDAILMSAGAIDSGTRVA